MASRRPKASYDGKIAGLYDLEDTIGRGHFAVVKLARHVFTGEKVAVKVIDKTKLDDVSRDHLFQEVRCMKLVQHPNVVRLYEVIDTQTKLYLILELGDGGDMYDYIMKHAGGLEENMAKRYFRQIVEAISYCHKLHVVHRDLKPENVVFFEKSGLVKLTDFGFSNMFAPGKKLETSCGSLAYSAPEILLGDSYDPPAVDVWSLGVILYMLVVGKPPFHESNDSETLTMIMDCRYHVPPHISEKCKELIGKMLQREPINRASLSYIIAHPWLKDGDLTPVSTLLPLITKEMISDEDHNSVVQRMVEGNIAAREEILNSIEKNSYDHITATYYLLIERKLRKHQQHEHHLVHQQPSSGSLRKQSTPSPSKSSSKPHLEPLMLSPRTTTCMTVNWNGLFSPPPTESVSHFDEFRKGPHTAVKQKEMKTKTAPVSSHMITNGSPSQVPSVLISFPSEEKSTSTKSFFTRSLTTSLTLDHRRGKKKASVQPVSRHVSPEVMLRRTGHGGKIFPAGASSLHGGPPILMVTGCILSKPNRGHIAKEPSTALDSERAVVDHLAHKDKQDGERVEQAAGEKGPKFTMSMQTRRGHQPDFIRQRIMADLETPGSPPAVTASCQGEGAQDAGSENMDTGTSHYVQSLVSPPSAHPSVAAKDTHLLPSTLAGSSTEVKLLAPPGAVARKCSLIKEESFDEYEDEEDDDYDMDTGTMKPVKSLESLDDLGIGSFTAVSSSPAHSPASPSTSDAVNPRRTLKSVCSSPQLLKQIHEENESEDEDDVVPLKIPAPRRIVGSSGNHRESSSTSPELLRKLENRKKRRGAGQRGTSCSSSDASDTDDTEGRSRKDKLKHKFIHRRDSSDHSSDTDGPGGSLGGNGRLRGSRSSASKGSYTRNGSEGRGGSGGGSGKGEKKENSDNKNQSNNCKNNSNNHKNSRQQCRGEFGGSKGSLTDSSLKLLTRKLSDISNGVGALLTDCRGSDCDNDCSPRKTPSTPQSPDYCGSIGSGSVPQHSRNTSLRSNSSNRSRMYSDSNLFILNESDPFPHSSVTSSPVQYLGKSTQVGCVCKPCNCQSMEFSEIYPCLAERDSQSSVAQGPPSSHSSRKMSRISQCRNSDLSCGVLHCKPNSGGVSVVPVESKCCSVV